MSFVVALSDAELELIRQVNPSTNQWLAARAQNTIYTVDAHPVHTDRTEGRCSGVSHPDHPEGAEQTWMV